MENIATESLQYRNIVRKFFFRQEPPKPLTKEEFINSYGEAYENEYYTYLYSYLSQYVNDLDQRVDKEISEGAVNDSYLAEIEKELEKNKDTKTYAKENEESVFQKMKKKDSNSVVPNDEEEEELEEEMEESKKKPFSLKKNFHKNKKNKKSFFQNTKEKIAKKMEKSHKKRGVRKNLIDGFSVFSLISLLAGGSGIYSLVLKTIISEISIKAGAIAIGTVFLASIFTASSLWVMHQSHQAKRTGTSLDDFDDFEDEEETEKTGFLQKLKDKFGLDDEKDYEVLHSDEDEIEDVVSENIDDTNDKQVDSSSVFKVQRKNDNRKPKFDKQSEKNHKPFQIGDTFIKQENKTDNLFDELDEEVEELKRIDGEIVDDDFSDLNYKEDYFREPKKVKTKY